LLSLLLLLLLLRPLNHPPHQISRFSQRRDHVGLLRVIELHPALRLPDTGERTCQRLCGTQLLLLLLRLLLLLLLLLRSLLLLRLLLLLAACLTLLTTLRHMISYLTRSLDRLEPYVFAEPSLSPIPIPDACEN
jgi:hypothetical protein